MCNTKQLEAFSASKKGEIKCVCICLVHYNRGVMDGTALTVHTLVPLLSHLELGSVF